MKTNLPEQELREAAWRRPLTATEQVQLEAWLGQHPEARADWEADSALSTVLLKLAAQPVASNFTARVLQALERDDLAASVRHASFDIRTTRGWLGSLGWVPRAVVVWMLLVAGLGVYHLQQQVVQFKSVRSIVANANATPMPSLTALQDYEVVSRLNLAPTADLELLALLK